MPVKTRETTIDGLEIKVVQFHGVRGFKLKTRLYKVLLPVLSPMLPVVTAAARSGKKEFSFMDFDIDELLPGALTTLAEQLDEDKFLQLALDLLSNTFVKDKVIDENSFDELFIGNYFLVYKLIAQVIKANGFFDLGAIGKGMAFPNLNSASVEKSKE